MLGVLIQPLSSWRKFQKTQDRLHSLLTDLDLAYKREQTVLNGKEMTHNNRSRLRPGASCFLRSTRRARPLLSGSEPRSSVGPPWSKVKTFYTSVNKERGTFQGALDEIVSRHTWYPTLFSGKKMWNKLLQFLFKQTWLYSIKNSKFLKLSFY